MNADIQKAVFDLFCICHDVTQAGPHQASMQYAAITNGVYVQVRPLAGATPVLDERVYLAGMPFQTEQQVLEELRALSDRVSEFLLPAQDEAA